MTTDIAATFWFEGNLDSARFYFRSNMPELIKLAEAERPSFRRDHLMNLAVNESSLGMADSARLHADRAVAEYSVAMDAYAGPIVLLRQARVYTMLGDAEGAFAVLDRALSAGHHGLKWELAEAQWAQLRQDSRYPALAAKFGLPE